MMKPTPISSASLPGIDRRSFVKTLLATGAATVFAPHIAHAASSGEKVRLACIGIGNRGADVI